MATMTISDMRSFINAQYPDSINWHRKVRGMKTNQVVAIYYSMRDRAAKKKHKEEEERKKKVKQEQQYHQIDMWEYLASIENNTTRIKVRD